MSLIKELKRRKYPSKGVFDVRVRSDHFTLLEYEGDFIYYEKTPIENIFFDDRHSVPWDFFSVDGLNYFLPRILYLIELEVEDLSISLLDFIINMTINDRIVELLFSLSIDEVKILIKIIEYIMYECPDDIVKDIGEHYLFLDLEFLTRILER